MSKTEGDAKIDSDKERNSGDESIESFLKAVSASTTVTSTTVNKAEPVTLPGLPIEPEIIAAETAKPCGIDDNTLPPGVGRRIQRTRRVKINPPGGETKQDPAMATTMKTTVTTTKTVVSNDNKKPVETEVVEDYAEYEDDSDEPSKALEAVMTLLHGLWNAIKGSAHVFKKLFSGVMGLVPMFFGLALFLLLIYLCAEYLVSPADERSVPTFSARLRYIVRCMAWALLPTVLGFAVSRWKKTEVHRRFADENFRQMVLLGMNCVVYGAHAEVDCLHWIWVLVVVTAVYSLVYWMSLCYGGGCMRRTFGNPPLAAITGIMFYNFCTVVGQDLGYIAPSDPPALPPNQPDQSGGYWKFVTMCQMVERVFCTPDGVLLPGVPH